MIQDIKGHLNDWTDPDETSAYLKKILAKETFDHSGLIYGMGHAVYSISDPREQILRSFVNELAIEKGRQDDLALYRNIEVEAPKLISKNRPIYKGVSANIDLYSGFLYDLLGIPMELYTPLFAIARIVGWSAHRIEQDHPPRLHERHAGARLTIFLPPKTVIDFCVFSVYNTHKGVGHETQRLDKAPREKRLVLEAKQWEP